MERFRVELVEGLEDGDHKSARIICQGVRFLDGVVLVRWGEEYREFSREDFRAYENTGALLDSLKAGGREALLFSQG